MIVQLFNVIKSVTMMIRKTNIINAPPTLQDKEEMYTKIKAQHSC